MGARSRGCDAYQLLPTQRELQRRGIRSRRKAPPARRPLPAQLAAAEPRPQEQRKWAVITLSGQTFASSGNDIWCGIADVMGRVNANIEDAAGTSMPSPVDPNVSPSIDVARTCVSSSPSFLVSAFHTHITPFLSSLADSREEEASGDSIAVAIFVKASMVESSVPLMTNLLHTRFPRLVCTVTVGGVTGDEDGEEGTDAASEPVAADELAPQRVLTGTVRLFGIDQVGQLAAISEILRSHRMTILNLLVTTGICDHETGEFIERVGGRLSENVIAVAAFDRSNFNEAVVREEITVAAHNVGYRVTSICLDSQEVRSSELAAYYLRRKAFMAQLSSTDTPVAPDAAPGGGAAPVGSSRPAETSDSGASGRGPQGA